MYVKFWNQISTNNIILNKDPKSWDVEKMILEKVYVCFIKISFASCICIEKFIYKEIRGNK